MLQEIKNAYLNGRLMLLLGAGASFGSRDSEKRELPMGEGLAEELAGLMGWPYGGEPLSSVYSAINAIDYKLLHEYLRGRMTNVVPSQEMQKIASYTWSRIYTLNIDDCLERSFYRSKTQKVSVFGRDSPLSEIDPIFKSVQIIKLNGSADRPEQGFIFSPQEYGEGSNRMPVWYRELGQNHSNYTFLFIGSKLNEPLFQHAMAEMRSITKRDPLRGYVITPKASTIEKFHLDSLNITHVSGTLKDFCDWLAAEIPVPPTGWDLATARRPELRSIQRHLSDSQKRALNSVIVVSPETIPNTGGRDGRGAIRDFFKGYKPQWVDIVENVPADLTFIRSFVGVVGQKYDSSRLIALVGPAGSGKTTALMIAALKLSRTTSYPVYFLREAVSDIKNVLRSLEEVNSEKYIIFIDKIDSMHNDIFEFLEENASSKVCIVVSERLNIWNRRVKSALENIVDGICYADRITSQDAAEILSKLEKFGPWTRLQPMTHEDRMRELINKADRQLLIGLMEATTGLGFTQIIARDFTNIGDEAHRKLFTVVGLASIHRSTISGTIVGSALYNLNILQDINKLTSEVDGIVVTNSDRYSARHPVYVRELFEKIVPTAMIRESLIALLRAFSDYEAPVIKHVGKSDGIVFKSIINHKFVREILRENEDDVYTVYSSFETKFHIDGLYWLQYGLALRDFGDHLGALDKFITAREAYSSPQIDHAYAQQLMIMATRSDEWQKAEPFLNEAIGLLRDLSRKAGDLDTYPIVALAEGHISVLVKFFGIEGTKSTAQQYANELLVMCKRVSNDRLKEAFDKVINFGKFGIWNESYGNSSESG